MINESLNDETENPKLNIWKVKQQNSIFDNNIGKRLDKFM